MNQLMYFIRFGGRIKIVKLTGKLTLLYASFIICAAAVFKQKTDQGFREKVNQLLANQLKEVKSTILSLQNAGSEKADREILKRNFSLARVAYKKMAVLTDYFNPFQGRYLNGPAIPRIESEIADRIIPPQGFQAIEQLIYADWKGDSSYAELNQLASAMIPILEKMENEPDRQFKFSKEQVYEAIRSAITGITTIGITGFDSPVVNQSFTEAIASFEGIEILIQLLKDADSGTDKSGFDNLILSVKKAMAVLNKQPDFNRFNRLDFITDFLDPLYRQLIENRDQTGVSIPEGRYAINLKSTSLFAADLMNVNFYSPPSEYWVTPERVYLGKLLFADPILSGTGTRSCASCHKPELAFTDGLDKPYSLNQSYKLKRNTPTVINSGFQTKQFFDSRADILENQLSEVVHNVEEMEGSMLESVEKLSKHPLYDSLFKLAYPVDIKKISPFTIANSISCYIRSLVSLNAPFDQYMRGNKNALSASAKRGFNLFAGKAKCATCHFIPLFNGVVPPAWAETESEVLGVPATADRKNPKLDEDPGKYLFTRAEVHRYSFKTPTLRNVALTAPYMHNGVYRTLDEVMEFYNKGGGKGLHIAPEYQTLPFDQLRLNRKEIKDIIAFMRSLTDTSFAK